MIDTLRLAARNLMRYRRRTWLTAALITIGMAAMLLFVALSGSFKQLMVGQITDSMLGHIQVHRKGYVASIDSLPLQLNLQPRQMNKLTSVMETIPGIEEPIVLPRVGDQEMGRGKQRRHGPEGSPGERLALPLFRVSGDPRGLRFPRRP